MTEQYLHGVEIIELNDGIRPVKINKSGVIGIVGTAPLADPDAFPLNEPVLLTSEPRKAALLGATGTLLPAIQQIYAEHGATIVVVRVAVATDINAQLSLVAGSITAKTGAYALLEARAHLGVPPRTLIAPGFTSQRPSGGANPVVTALLAVAERVRGRVYADSPATHAAAIAYRADWASDRVGVFYPTCRVWDVVASAYVDRPQSASQAGLTARVHDQNGFWFSPSNHALTGVGGTSESIDFALGDPNCEANILNENQIITLINQGGDFGGWRRWGNATCADDPLWRFEAVRTSLDLCYEAIQEAERWAVDKPPSRQILIDMQEMVQQFFNYGKKTGFLLGGRIWLDPERNPPVQTVQGIWAWDIDPEAPAPMEHIKNYAHRNPSYYSDLVASLVGQVRQG